MYINLREFYPFDTHTDPVEVPDKQAKRLYAFFFLNMSKSEIAKAEGVNKSQVSRSIGAALEKLALDLKNLL